MIKDGTYGVVKFLMKVVNQHGRVVQMTAWSLLMLRKCAGLDDRVDAGMPEMQPEEYTT